jgi:molecular chaperone GrpE
MEPAANQQASSADVPAAVGAVGDAPPPGPLETLPSSGETSDAGAVASSVESSGDLETSSDVLSKVLNELSAIRNEFADRLRYDAAKERAFDRLYSDLDQLRADREFDGLKPLYLDLILLFDRLDHLAANAPPAEQGGQGTDALLASLRDEVLEVLYRREIEIVQPVPTVFDPTIQRAIGVQYADSPRDDNSIVSVVRNGFRFRKRLLRPQEVIVAKYRDQNAK